MAKKFSIKGAALEIYDDVALKNDYVLPLKKLWYRELQLQAGAIELINVDAQANDQAAIRPVMLADSLSPGGAPFSANSFRVFAEKYFTRPGAADVVIQDSTSPMVIAPFSNVANETTLAQATALNDYDITVTDPTGFTVDKFVTIFSIAANRFYLATVQGAAGSVITLDMPLDYAFSAGDPVTAGSDNMAVDGSSTRQIFGLRNTEQSIGASYDITRLMFLCHTSGTLDLSKFGDIAGGLTRGVVIRKKDGVYRNIMNLKKNYDLDNIMYDFKMIQKSGGANDGFVGSFTFTKLGSVQRLRPGEDLQVIIQDDLTELISFRIIAEGSEVVD